MSNTVEFDASQSELIDSRIQKYAQLGYSREKTLQQLLNARLPVELLKERFSEMPVTAFEVVPPKPITRSITATVPRQADPPSLTRASTPSLQPVSTVTISATRTVQSVPQTKASGVTAEEGISFQYVPLIQCSFPHGDPGNVSSFTRRNGWLELTLGTTRPETGLPYGVPARLLTIYCASEAMRTRSPEIFLGKSVHDFLRLLDIPITRGARGSLTVYTNQLLRLVHSTLSIDENIQDAKGRAGIHIRQALFVDEAQLWWDESTSNGHGSKRSLLGTGSSLVLSHVLFDSILERSAPLATNAIKQLRKSPMDLDVYAWLVHRLFTLSRPSMVSWEQLGGQFGHGYVEQRMFKRFFCDSLKRVLAVYPGAKLNVTQTGVLLLPSKPHVAKSLHSSKR